MADCEVRRRLTVCSLHVGSASGAHECTVVLDEHDELTFDGVSHGNSEFPDVFEAGVHDELHTATLLVLVLVIRGPLLSECPGHVLG